MAEHKKFTTLNQELYEYVEQHGHNSDPIRAELARETGALGMISAMQIAAEQGTFMQLLARSTSFDFAFIDADKSNYRNYYEEILKRLRVNGLILIDNVIWGGKVLDSKATDPDTVAIRELNDFIAKDDRVEAVMLPIADGLTI